MQNSYDSIADNWHASQGSFQAKKYVDLLLTRLKPGDKVLDLGCGTGIPIAQYLVQNGFQVVGVDNSIKMLGIAKKVVPEAEFIQTDICEMNISGRFAAAIAWDSIFHIERTHHQEVFRKLSSLLQQDGWILLSAGGSGEEGFTSEMFGQSFFYSGYEPEETLRSLRVEGFEIDLWEVDDPSSRGHIAIIAKKIS